jgi:hypothetical protein
MRSQPIAVSGQQEASPVSPVIAGGTWLGDDDPGQSLTLQLRLPISAEELAAALHVGRERNLDRQSFSERSSSPHNVATRGRV